MLTDPRTTYSQLLDQRRSGLAHLQTRHRGLGYAKLGAAAVALVIVWLSLAREAFSIVWLLLPIAVFAVLVVVHEIVMRAMERIRRAERYFENALKRLDGNWQGAGEPGDRYIEPEHPYALDLDLFGK